jgi:superfamily II DNA or RNA helicase
LILVHRRHLLDQWLERLNAFLVGDGLSIGRFGDGKRAPSGVIDVALIQSLHRKSIVDDRVAGYGQIIVDECHHLSAVSFENVARRCKAKYVLGLSATAIIRSSSCNAARCAIGTMHANRPRTDPLRIG